MITFVKHHINSIKDFTKPSFVLCEYKGLSGDDCAWLFKPKDHLTRYPLQFRIIKNNKFIFAIEGCYCIKIELMSSPEDKVFRLLKKWPINDKTY